MLFERETIFEFDPDHPHCHCPVIQELPNGELMVVYYAGKNEAHPTVGLMASWKPIKGGAWTKPVLIHKTPKLPDGNAVLAWYRDKLYMFYDVVHFPLFPWFNTKLYLKTSNDLGRTWSESRLIVGRRGFVVRTKPLILGDRMLVPGGNVRFPRGVSNVLITEDGENFHVSKDIVLPKGNNEQPAITRLSDGSLLAYLRTDMNHVYRSTSKDLGETWTPGEQLPLNNPNSALDLVRTVKGEIVLVWNNNPRRGNMAQNRRCLNIAYSPDEGKTWPVVKDIERDETDGHFSYPAIIIGSDGLFHLVYNNRRRNMRYCRFDVDWVTSA
nr:sialidase family protein [Candidatus Sigynarchaeum springense]